MKKQFPNEIFNQPWYDSSLLKTPSTLLKLIFISKSQTPTMNKQKSTISLKLQMHWGVKLLDGEQKTKENCINFSKLTHFRNLLVFHLWTIVVLCYQQKVFQFITFSIKFLGNFKPGSNVLQTFFIPNKKKFFPFTKNTKN